MNLYRGRLTFCLIVLIFNNYKPLTFLCYNLYVKDLISIVVIHY